MRTALLLGAAAAAAASFGAAQLVAPPLDVEPGLQLLMRGMAAIKGGIALLALALVWWRLARPLSPRRAAAYLAGTWVLAVAPPLIWQMAFVPATAFAFHAAEIALLVVAWRDGAPPRERSP